MKLKIFIDRPILAGVISVLIMFLGIIGLAQLPIEQFPEIAPPTVSVSASYSGANAETVQKSVIVPLEEALNGVENMMYMSSSATNTGSASISVYFKQGTDADMATVNVQNRIASATSLLPAEVTRSGVTVRKRQTSNILSLGIYSPTNQFDQLFLNNYLKINIEPRLSRIAGVGEINVMGADYSMRIWLDPQKMAQHSLIPSDITTVLSEQNIESSTGTLGADTQNTFQYTLKYRGRYENEVDFENMVVKATENGEVLRLKDIARIELGAVDYSRINQVNGHSGAMCMITQTPGSNANDIIIEIEKAVEQISKDLPEGIALTTLMNVKTFLDASIKNVIITLIEAILLVILVVYFFLQSIRSTIIPTASIIVSLIGTFAFLYFGGFTINMLTLSALILVIGTVVDDAIVVVEAVQAKFDAGYKSSYEATVAAMGGITSALITTTLVFMAVFIPVSLMGGTTGTFYTQFGLTMAVAVGISTINALTLSPALCALIMTPHMDKESDGKLSFSSRFHLAFDASFGKLLAKYKNRVQFFIKKKWLSFLLLIGSCVGLVYMMQNTKTGFVPDEDMGTIFVIVQTAPGSSVNSTAGIMDEIEVAIKDIPEIEIYSKSTGSAIGGGQGSNTGMFIILLKSWEKRAEKGQDITSVIQKIYKNTSHINGATIRANARPMITGYGVTSGFEINLQDQKGGKIEDLFTVANNLIIALNERPEISRSYTSFDPKFPQYMVEVDAAVCKINGVSPDDVLSTLAGYVGGSYSSNINRFSKLYRVMVQASPEFRLDTKALDNIHVRNSDGQMSPISQYLTLRKDYGAATISRFNLFNSITVNGVPADGYSSGQALKAIAEVTEQVLPTGYGYEFGGMSREESSSSNSSAIVYVISIVFVFLILCALYESLLIPLAVILSIPFGLAGSFLFAQIFGLDNNIYMQTGLIMLIGLLAKTAILITEFASEKRREGLSIKDAALAATQERLRPILMTSLTMIIGMLPLMFATGVGANGNISLGVGTVGGMLVGTIALLFIVPVLFIFFQNLQERIAPKRIKS
ncbi:MAG: efflux RND transporter permease subunit [Rikenellaceae bacterium]